MATVLTFAAELKSWLPSIDPLACPTLVARGLKDIFDKREWSFNKITGCWLAPSIVTTGTCTTAQFSNQVVGDSTASPAWLAIALPLPPAQPITVRQFRVTGGPIYNIIGYDGASTLTLDRPYAELGFAGSSYMIYQPYVPALSIDHKRWLSWVDPINNYRFRYNNLFWTQKEVDKRDPNRQSWSIPIAIAAHDYIVYPGDTQQRPRYEAWPHPVQQIGYIVEYMIRGYSFINSQLIPSQIPDQLVMARARYYGHNLVANQPDTDIKTKAYHMQMMRSTEAEYNDLLQRAKVQDNSIFDDMVVTEETGPMLSGPLDADYLMSHVLYIID